MIETVGRTESKNANGDQAEILANFEAQRMRLHKC